MFRALSIAFLSLTLSIVPALAATRILVNGQAISDVQIDQRAKLHKLEGKSGTKAAQEELINEAIQAQEAKRLGIVVTDGQVEDAFVNVARNLKLSTTNLTQVLTANGIRVDTLKERLRGALEWQGIAQTAVRPRVQISDVELDKAASAKLTEDSSYDYILKEVLFIVPPKGSAAKRTSEANQYRKNFPGCDGAVRQSLSFTDAAVRDIGRRHATQLPDPIAKELAGLNVGGITKPRVVEAGVSMLVVCSKTAARDLTFIKSGLRQQQGSEAYKAEGEKYLAELRAKAQIVYQ